MLGFIVGSACLYGLIRVLHGGRGHGRGCGFAAHGCGHDCGRGGGRGWHGRAFHGDRFDGGTGGGGFEDVDGGPVLLRGLLARLGTTPGQERVMLDALRELRASVKRSAEERAQGAKQVAEALRGEDFKVENMGEAYVHLDAGAEAVRDASFTALAKIHAALDAGQRRILADFIARGGAALETLAAQV